MIYKIYYRLLMIYKIYYRLLLFLIIDNIKFIIIGLFDKL
jgi:hypothetical protein